jgi:transcription termination/antitermination protein NusG
MSLKWYVLQVYSGHESKVKSHIDKMVEQKDLHDKITQVKVPIMDVAEMKNGKKKVTKKKVMPGYVLIEMEISEEIQFLIQKLPSVSTFVGKYNEPEPLSSDEVKNLFSELDSVKSEESVKPRMAFSVGETLKIVDGPFANFSGIVDEIFPEKGRLRLKVEIFGRSTPVELDFLQVGKNN